MKQSLKDLLYVGALVVSTLGAGKLYASYSTKDLKEAKIQTRAELVQSYHELDSLNTLVTKQNYEKARLKSSNFKFNKNNYLVSNSDLRLERK